MDQSTRITKLFRALQFRKHVKELTSACYDLVTYRHGTTPNKFNIIRSKICKSKTRTKSSTRDQLAKATASSPANILMIVKQSYKPLHDKSKNTIAVTKDTLVNALYLVSNWICIQIPETNQTGFVPISCLSSIEKISEKNLSLLNVSHIDKQISLSNGQFLSSIGPCHFHLEQQSTIKPIDQSHNLSRQISNMSLHAYDHDAYGTLNLTPCRNLSISRIDIEPSSSRLRIAENYQRQFIGDISVLESEIVTLVKTNSIANDWTYIRRGDGRQGFIPKQILQFE